MNNREKDKSTDLYRRTYYGSLLLLFIVFTVFLIRTSVISVPKLYGDDAGDTKNPEVPLITETKFNGTQEDTVADNTETVHQKNIINDLTVQEKLVNINSASAGELCTIKGIGPKTAEAIVKYREENGTFKNKEDLMKVKGIGKKKFSDIAEKIVL